MKPDLPPDAAESCPIPTPQSDGRVGDEGEFDFAGWKRASWIGSAIRRRYRGAHPVRQQRLARRLTNAWRPVSGVPSPLHQGLTALQNEWHINAADSLWKAATGRSHRTNMGASKAD